MAIAPGCQLQNRCSNIVPEHPLSPFSGARPAGLPHDRLVGLPLQVVGYHRAATAIRRVQTAHADLLCELLK